MMSMALRTKAKDHSSKRYTLIGRIFGKRVAFLDDTKLKIAAIDTRRQKLEIKLHSLAKVSTVLTMRIAQVVSLAKIVDR